ncbi:hypothetical protein HMPREF2826_05055 [Olsenella sp. HMSC062G07]|nr:hypothetical protein HMPREF2826_05055 [Olsenella sp. HMSC062G07]
MVPFRLEVVLAVIAVAVVGCVLALRVGGLAGVGGNHARTEDTATAASEPGEAVTRNSEGGASRGQKAQEDRAAPGGTDGPGVSVCASPAEEGSWQWRSERPLDEEARTLLATYQGRGDCVLAQAGRLDLMGREWGCVVQGEGWVDVCRVSDMPTGGSRVSVVRMGARAWKGELDAPDART